MKKNLNNTENKLVFSNKMAIRCTHEMKKNLQNTENKLVFSNYQNS